jgi:DNA-binding transcriptional LysR family regulator
MRWDERVGRRLKLKDLHMLEAIAKHGSMARASEDLAISQPAISKAMADLEHNLGAALLDRSARGVALTECGHVLLRRGRVVFDEIRQGLDEIQHLSDPTAGEVRVGTVEGMTPLIASIVDRASPRYPKMRFQVVISDVTTLLRQLRDRELDLVIARWMSSDSVEDLAAEVLFNDRLAIVAGAGHRLASRRKHLLLRDLMDEQWALPPHDSFFGRLAVQAFQTQGLDFPKATVTSISVQLRSVLLQSGRFLTIHPHSLIQHPANRGRLRALPVNLGDAAGPIASITLRTRPPVGAAKLFAEETRKVATVIASAVK